MNDAARARHRTAGQGRPGCAPALRRHVDGELSRPRRGSGSARCPGARNRASASAEIDSTSRSSCTTPGRTSRSASTSASVVAAGPGSPGTRDVFGKPICSSTGDGSSGCPEQSDPAASRMPRSSSAIISVAGSRPSTLKQTRCGARCVGCPWTRAPGTSLAIRSRSRPVSVQSRAARSAMSASDAVSAAAMPAIPGVFSMPGSPLALAVVAAGIRGDADPAPHVERPDAGRSAELVRRERQQVDLERLDVHREPSDRLAGVGVEPDVRLPSQAGGLGHLLQRSQLVVRVLDAGEQRAGRADLGGVPIHVDAPVGVDRDHHDLEAVALQHVADAARPRDAPQHRSRRGCPARGSARTPPQIASATDSVPPEVNTSSSGCAWIAAADHAARVVDQPPCRAAGPVDVQRVAERVQGGHHRVASRRQERSGRRRIEVDVPAHRRLRLPPASPDRASRRGGLLVPEEQRTSTRRRRGSPPAIGPTIHTYQSSQCPRRERGPEPPGGVERGARPRADRQDAERDGEADGEPGGRAERTAIVDDRREHRPDQEERPHRLEQDALARRDARRRASGRHRERRRTPAREPGTSGAARRPRRRAAAPRCTSPFDQRAPCRSPTGRSGSRG